MIVSNLAKVARGWNRKGGGGGGGGSVQGLH